MGRLNDLKSTDRGPAAPSAETSQPGTDCHFNEETLKSFRDLGDVLLRIHNRLISEGYIIRDGNISHGSTTERQPNTKGN
jgi:hypothetical protein